ncbi:MAG: hypothetical protein ACE5E5_02310 [Phycisphaerae bacterium]
MIRPLASRKVRVALATVLSAIVVEFGFNVGEELMLTIVSMGVALILGIAHEDAGLKSGAGRRPPTDG